MIIGIDASQANKKNRTGTEWYAFYILREWIQSNYFKNHTVRLYVQSELQPDFGILPNSWEVKILPWPPKVFWTQIRLSLEILAHRPHVLFIPSHTIPIIHPKKTVTTIHDIGFEVRPDLYSDSSVVHLRSKSIQKILALLVRIFTLGKYGASELDYHKFSVRFALKHAKLLFTVSKFSKSEIIKIFDKYPDIEVAYNGIQHNEFYNPYPIQKINKVKETYNLNNPYILSIGRVEKKKNSLETVKIFQQIVKKIPERKLDLVFAGGFGYGSDEVKEYVLASGLGKRVKFLGWIDQVDLPPLLAGASIFAFFSSYEGFGVPLIQSLAMGVPTIASDLEVFKEISNNAAILLSPENTERCANECIRLLENKNDDQINRGKEAALRFTWKSTSEVIGKKIYEILAKNS